MRKKLLHSKMMAVLAVILVLFLATGFAEEERMDAGGLWKYVLEDGGAMITGYEEEPSGDLVFPGELDGVPVTGIEKWTRGYVFLDSITIPDGVKSIGDNAFAGFNGLMGGVTLPDSLMSIGDRAFSGCAGLTSITIPEGVTSIGDEAFYLTSLSNVTIPESVTHIGSLAFGCYYMRSVTIPAGVTSMGRNPFFESAVESIGVSPDNPAYEQIDGVLFDKRENKLIAYPRVREGSYIIPEGTKEIGECAFYASGGLTGVTVPDGVTGIGKEAFAGCYGLTSVILPDSVVSIGDNAFYDCLGLTGATIPNGVTSIGSGVFKHCRDLTSVILPAGVTDIGKDAFLGCEDIVISVIKGSYAEQYVQENGIAYVLTDGL